MSEEYNPNLFTTEIASGAQKIRGFYFFMYMETSSTILKIKNKKLIKIKII